MVQGKENDKSETDKSAEQNAIKRESIQTLHGGSERDELTVADCAMQNTEFCAKKMLPVGIRSKVAAVHAVCAGIRHARHSLTDTPRHHRYQRALLRGSGIANRRISHHHHHHHHRRWIHNNRRRRRCLCDDEVFMPACLHLLWLPQP